jgi:hypothetical protein
LHELHQVFQFSFQNVVVVLAIGVRGDFGCFGVSLFFRVEIVESQADNRFSARHQQGRVNAQVKVVLHVGHSPVRLPFEPLLQPARLLVELFRPSKAYRGKAEALGFRPDHFRVPRSR